MQCRPLLVKSLFLRLLVQVIPEQVFEPYQRINGGRMMTLRASFALCAILMLSGHTAHATASLAPVNGESIQGAWESLDWESRTFFLLQVSNTGMVLAISNGSAANDYAFRATAVSAKDG